MHRPSLVRPPRAMALRMSLMSGFAALVMAVILRIPYNVEIRITHLRKTLVLAGLVFVTFALGYLISLSVRIGRQSKIDEARVAYVIIVMGAAQYNGHPSPVLKLRLDH